MESGQILNESLSKLKWKQTPSYELDVTNWIESIRIESIGLNQLHQVVKL